LKTTDASGAEQTTTVEETASVVSVKRDGLDIMAELSNGKEISVYELTQIRSKEDK
jgi:flagellar basal-body rod modification protein FlgD